MLFYLFAWTSELYESPFKDQVQNGLFSNATNPNILPVNISFLQKRWMYKLQLSSSEHSICQTGFLRFTYGKRHFLSTDYEHGWAIKHFKFQSLLSKKTYEPSTQCYLQVLIVLSAQTHRTNNWHRHYGRTVTLLAELFCLLFCCLN